MEKTISQTYAIMNQLLELRVERDGPQVWGGLNKSWNLMENTNSWKWGGKDQLMELEWKDQLMELGWKGSTHGITVE